MSAGLEVDRLASRAEYPWQPATGCHGYQDNLPYFTQQISPALLPVPFLDARHCSPAFHMTSHQRIMYGDSAVRYAGTHKIRLEGKRTIQA